MSDLQSQTSEPSAGARQPIWRRPALLWSMAFILVLLSIWLVTSDGPKPQNATEQAAQSPTENGADLQWLNLSGTAGESAEDQSATAPVEAPGRTFIAKLNLQPRLRNGRTKGYVVSPGDPSILKGTPLQPGDVLLEVDGLELNAARAAVLANNVGDYQDVFVRFERGNREMDGMLPLGTR